MPRFAVLIHDHPELHWDFLLEKEAGLRTWRLQFAPDHDGVIPAMPLPDHRREYLDYEGPVSGNRGSVGQWDSGDFERLEETDRIVRVRLRGRKLQAEARIALRADGTCEFTFARRSVSQP